MPDTCPPRVTHDTTPFISYARLHAACLDPTPKSEGVDDNSRDGRLVLRLRTGLLKSGRTTQKVLLPLLGLDGTGRKTCWSLFHTRLGSSLWKSSGGVAFPSTGRLLRGHPAGTAT